MTYRPTTIIVGTSPSGNGTPEISSTNKNFYNEVCMKIKTACVTIANLVTIYLCLSAFSANVLMDINESFIANGVKLQYLLPIGLVLLTFNISRIRSSLNFCLLPLGTLFFLDHGGASFVSDIFVLFGALLSFIYIVMTRKNHVA